MLIINLVFAPLSQGENSFGSSSGGFHTVSILMRSGERQIDSTVFYFSGNILDSLQRFQFPYNQPKLTSSYFQCTIINHFNSIEPSYCNESPFHDSGKILVLLDQNSTCDHFDRMREAAKSVYSRDSVFTLTFEDFPELVLRNHARKSAMIDSIQYNIQLNRLNI